MNEPVFRSWSGGLITTRTWCSLMVSGPCSREACPFCKAEDSRSRGSCAPDIETYELRIVGAK